MIRLANRPATCVRFDRHAIYLGQPGLNQACPSGLMGATGALLVQPAGTRVGSTGGTAASGSMTGGAMAGGAMTGGTMAGSAMAGGARNGAGGVSVEDPVSHRITVTTPRIIVTATYGTDRPQILAILSSAGLPRPVVQSPARLASEAPATSGVSNAVTNDLGKGFDACTAPSPAAMSAWLANSHYQAVGVYIGGSDRACAQANLTAAWVRQQAAAGWHFFPLYVGPQVAFGEVTTRSAASQAVSAAQDAVVQAATLGFPRGTPIYYDMEAYSPSQGRAAMLFFSAWTTELHTLGYRSGIYSSSSSGISDLAGGYQGGVYAMPDVIDDAWWNGVRDTTDPNIPLGDWANHQRIHQYSGNVTLVRGGYQLNIDKDYLDVQFGPVPSPGGGTAIAAPARQASHAVAASGKTVGAFYRGTDGRLWYAGYRSRAGWAAPVNLGDAVTSQPSAVTAPGGAVEVFFRGPGGGLEAVTSRPDGRWSRPVSLRMGTLGSAPVAVSTADGGIDVFWRGADRSQLWGSWLVPGVGWHGPFHLASGLDSPASPAVSGASTVSVFWKGTDGQLWHISRTGGGVWSAPAALPMGQLGTGPYATGQRGGQVEVFWGGTGRGSIWHATYTAAGGWSRQTLLTHGRRGALALVASSASTAAAFWKGRHGRLWYASGHAGTGWGTAIMLLSMGRIGGDVFAAGRPNGTIDVFWRGTGVPHLWHARYHPASGRWTGPDDLGGTIG